MSEFIPPMFTALCWPRLGRRLTEWLDDPMTATGRTQGICEWLNARRREWPSRFPFGMNYVQLTDEWGQEDKDQSRPLPANATKRWLTEGGGGAFAPLTIEFDPRHSPDRSLELMEPEAVGKSAEALKNIGGVFEPMCVIPHLVRPSASEDDYGNWKRNGWNSEGCYVPAPLVGFPLDLDGETGDGRSFATMSAADVAEYVRAELEQDVALTASRSSGGKNWHCVLFARLSEGEFAWRELKHIRELACGCVRGADDGMRSLMTLAIDRGAREWNWFAGKEPAIECDELLAGKRAADEKRKTGRKNGARRSSPVEWRGLLDELGVRWTTKAATGAWVQIKCPFCQRDGNPDGGTHLGLHEDGGYSCLRNTAHKGGNAVADLEAETGLEFVAASARHTK